MRFEGWSMLAEAGNARVLLLQGPIGPFFRRFADELELAGATVTKVNFNGGDDFFFSGSRVVRYTGTLEGFDPWLQALARERRIDRIYLFGDRRPYHRRAKAVANALGLPIYVFEEGYLRPDFVTLERGGVNGDSCMPRCPDSYRAQIGRAPMPVQRVGHTFWYAGVYAAAYAWAVTLTAKRYPHYRHHRDMHAVREGLRWIFRGGVRKLRWAYRDRGVLEHLLRRHSGDFVLVPLQVHNDGQWSHSDFESLEDFVSEVATSFAQHAPPELRLVIKHHPMDRAYRDHTALIRRLGAELGIADRLYYVADLHLPTLLKHARGTVVMNSTVGLSSLHHGTPVKTLGRAIYDLPGLTYQGSLGTFWSEPGPVDRDLLQGFRRWLEANNQINGSFYRRLGGASQGTGMRWGAFGDTLSQPEAKEIRYDHAT